MVKRLTDENRLSLEFPDVAAEWHPTLNGNITPHDVPFASNIKRWWLCAREHEWQAMPNNRTGKGSGCPYCSRRLPTEENMLSIQRPDVAKLWHPTKNGNLTPDDVSISSGKRVWWLCEEGHEKKLAVCDRTREGRGCRKCSMHPRNFTDDRNRLSKKCPDLVDEWHPTKNGDLTPDDVPYASRREVWWICREGHEWESAVLHRGFHGAGCPRCKHLSDDNRLSIVAPEGASLWHPTKNGELTPKHVAYSSHRKAWFLCPNGHEFHTQISSVGRVKINCPKCILNGRSLVEIKLACELKYVFPSIKPEDTFSIATNEGKTVQADIAIPSHTLIIEYDGEHWHKNDHDEDIPLDKDIAKTEALEFTGWRVLRVREKPLPLVLPTDMSCEVTQPKDVKRLTDEVLRHLITVFGIETKKMNEYLQMESVVNEELAESIIDGPSTNFQPRLLV